MAVDIDLVEVVAVEVVDLAPVGTDGIVVDIAVDTMLEIVVGIVD